MSIEQPHQRILGAAASHLRHRWTGCHSTLQWSRGIGTAVGSMVSGKGKMVWRGPIAGTLPTQLSLSFHWALLPNVHRRVDKNCLGREIRAYVSGLPFSNIAHSTFLSSWLCSCVPTHAQRSGG